MNLKTFLTWILEAEDADTDIEVDWDSEPSSNEHMDQGFLGSPNGQFNYFNYLVKNKVECVFPMVIVSMLLHAEFGPNDHREDAPYFRSDQVYLQLFYTKIRVWLRCTSQVFNGSLYIWQVEIINQDKKSA